MQQTIFEILLCCWMIDMSFAQTSPPLLALTCHETRATIFPSEYPGRPGKRGPLGPAGPPGPRGVQGAKGDRGSDFQQSNLVNLLQRRVNELEAEMVTTPPRSCSDLMLRSNLSDIYTVYPFPVNVGKAIDVFCDMETDGGGWMVIQRRTDASVNFERTWVEYENGFGRLEGNYWFGLKDLHKITAGKTYELRIDLQDFDNVERYAKYNVFRIGSPTTMYRLIAEGFSGNAGDSLGYHSNKPFTTKDRDNDNISNTNCAIRHKGAWWYGHGRFCYNANLNGVYETTQQRDWTGIVWNGFRSNYSLKRVEIKIRILK